MNIAITIDEVLRDMISQMDYVYQKYIGPVNFKYEDVTSPDLSESFKFESKELFNRFCYEEASMELFASADQMKLGQFEAINEFLYDFYADKEHKITVLTKAHGRAVPATLFWLSKVGSDFRNFEIVPNYDEVWEKYDMIITATPEILESKPEDKFSIKVECPYNKESKADFTVKETDDIFKNQQEFYNKLNLIKQI